MIWTISSRASPLPPGNWCDALSTVWAELAAEIAHSAAAAAKVEANVLMGASPVSLGRFFWTLKERNFPKLVKAPVVAARPPATATAAPLTSRPGPRKHGAQEGPHRCAAARMQGRSADDPAHIDRTGGDGDRGFRRGP